MSERLAKAGELYQNEVVYEIERRFGDEFVYVNDNGNSAISPAVLGEFRKMTPDAVWIRSQRYWRRREASDEPNKRAQEY